MTNDIRLRIKTAINADQEDWNGERLTGVRSEAYVGPLISVQMDLFLGSFLGVGSSFLVCIVTYYHHRHRKRLAPWLKRESCGRFQGANVGMSVV